MDVKSYLSGYVDGEGCFCISFNKSSRHSFGWEIRPSFSVSQNSNRKEVLEIMKGYFNCGSIRPDRSDKTLFWKDATSFWKTKRLWIFFNSLQISTKEEALNKRGIKSSPKTSIQNESIRKKKIFSSWDKDIVYTRSNMGEMWSSDPHEWRNDLGAVSERDSAK